MESLDFAGPAVRPRFRDALGEVALFGTADNAPWLLASRLREMGARHEQGDPYQAFTIQDANLFTGQNPASSTPMADAINTALAAG